ncbi:ROK family protein [Dysgonomonas sp. Marseille-P4677]|uniref:ROK family protein n=1 Tax=Dysgonomonas sp. Marseille-P4677 TaxID=2364790 RepID=UPI00191394DD|nr:ROK family protein [Dysgonomonas sp. Marseille-P4677]MBK5720811.1 ROK family protein [Dysgonomonas sp. Marseille-P4677]
MYQYDKRIVLTLDAGGTNFVFSAIQGNREIVNALNLPAETKDLQKCLDTLVRGFEEIWSVLNSENKENPVAISFAFPGPADYENGVIGDLPNFSAFKGGVALGPYLERKFKIPVFINNDGNLFAYGEALAGALPQINRELKEQKCNRQYKNLIGITFGTGFGSGVVVDNKLLCGDNGCGGDIWVFRNKLNTTMIAEENVSIRAIVREYKRLSNDENATFTPKTIFDIAEGKSEGNKNAAIKSFELFGEAAGDSLAYMLTVIDGIIVLGGGIVGAAKYILPAMMKEMRSTLTSFDGSIYNRLEMDIYNINDADERAEFFIDKTKEVKIPDSNDVIRYRSSKQVAVMISSIGTNTAVSLGAYAFALSKLDECLD